MYRYSMTSSAGASRDDGTVRPTSEVRVGSFTEVGIHIGDVSFAAVNGRGQMSGIVDYDLSTSGRASAFPSSQ